MKKVALMCDSGADVTIEEARRLNLFVVRLSIYVDGKEYEEGTELDHNQLAQMLDEGRVAKTSQPSPGKLKEMWDKILEEYDEIFYIPVSAPLSGTYSVAKTLSQEYGDRVKVVYSNYGTNAVTDLLMDVRALIEKGVDTEEIAQRIEKEVKMEAFILPYDLHTLKRGGRISPAIAALAGFLKIQVLLKLNEEGVIVQVDKTRSVSKVKNIMIEKVLRENFDDYHWGILHSSDLKSAKELQLALKEKTNREVRITELLAIIRAHTGNKTIGIYRINKLR